MKIVFLTRHQGLGASSRYRSLQYFDALRAKGHEVEQRYFYCDAYLRARYAGKTPVRHMLSAYVRRAGTVFAQISTADAIIVEKEAFPLLPAFTEGPLVASKAAVIYDYDDAIWHSYRRRNLGPLSGPLDRKFARVVARADHIVVGSRNLEDQVRAWGAPSVTLIPTTVPARRYDGAGMSAAKTIDLVWIGSMSTGPHVETIFPVLKRIHEERGSKIRLIGFPRGRLGAAPPAFVDICTWSPDTELGLMASARIGIMPVPDHPFERGKCGFKLVQYMGLGLPVIASPVGENRHIVEPGETGLLASSPEEWHAAVTRLLDDPGLAAQMGRKGRERFLVQYSTETAALRLEDVIERSVEAKRRASSRDCVIPGRPTSRTR